ncbi:MAG TPA: VCBS repeat-containing protein [Bacteroidales bacterium]|nr:VCBS repeat-containing protein [Bacteroidales bacterium]
MQKKKLKNLIPVAIVIIVILGIPLLFLNYQAKRSGMTRGEVLQRIFGSSATGVETAETIQADNAGEKIDFLDQEPIGLAFSDPPLIAHLQVVDLDKDDLLDVIVCDDKGNFVSWIRQFPAGTYTEKVIAGDIIAPSHVQAIDFDNDGDTDLVVGVLGMLFPNNDKIGSVVILENDGLHNFTKHVIVEKIARVSDVRAGDLDNDGDMDLAVAQFGYDDGETRWIENLGNWSFQSHILQSLSGPINVELIDIDKDNDLDIISLVSQEWEEIYCFINNGGGNFQAKRLWGSSNQDYGSSGISICDADQDGDEDILYTNGDAFDYIPPQGRPWHGVQWLENKGNLVFEFHRLCSFTGATNVRPADIDKDGDIDFFAVSAFNLWDKPGSFSFIWLENTGNMQYIRHEIAKDPTHLLTCEPGDFNNDGLIDIVTGGMHTYPPYDRMGRVTLWMNNGK